MPAYADFQTAPTFVNTLIMKGLADLFANPKKGVFEAFTEMRGSTSNLNNLSMTGGTGGMRKWTGSKVFNQMRMFSQNSTTANYENSLIIDADMLRFDQTGQVGQRVNQFLADQIDFYDIEAAAALIANGTCIDGSALFVATHPYATAAGGTQSNLGSTALSLTQLDAICIVMSNYTYEGKLLNVNPDTIMVGRKLLRLALEICESPQRLVAVANDGVESGTRIGVTNIPQVYPGGRLTVVYNPRLNGTYDDYYYVIDSKFAGGKPLIGIETIKPHLVAQASEDSWFRFTQNKYIWSVEANVGFFPYNPLCCYASVL